MLQSVLPAIGDFMRAFSIHEKHENSKLNTIDEAIYLISGCVNKFELYEKK